jgi:predicted nucleic acid-binding protein
LIVVDTNVIFYFFLSGEYSQSAESVLEKDPHWASSVLWRSEFRNVLATYIRRGLIDFERAALIAEEAERQMEENEYEVNSAEVLSLAARSGCTAYDCEFVSLARELRVPLITTDKAILAAFPETAISLEEFARK